MSLSSGMTLGHYEIRSKLGEGGMGEVYLAQDTKLDRKVALKILPADVAGDQTRMRRFVQEAKTASALNHPNILTIYEIDETESRHFIATEFIDGRTLREHMRAAPMNLGEVLDVSVQIAGALAAAHSAGIVHRDIKPENIMIRHDGYVKVLDFGLAKLAEPKRRASNSEAETIQAIKTMPGVIMGTVNYMSPEQARGLKIDERSDIWSAGVLMYEMIAGETPFDAPTNSDVIASILKTEPPSLTSRSPNLPTEMQRIVKKALRKNREDRYPAAKDLLVDLKNLQRDLEHETTTHSAEQAFRSVAILPFKNLTNNSSVEFYEFSLADAVITELVRLRSLVVRPSSAIARYVGEKKDPLEAARELKVNAVLAASFLHSGSRIRVTAQLLDAATGEVLWGDRIDSDADDIIRVQDIIAQRIVDGLQLKLGSDEHVDLAGHATSNAAAYEKYLRGRDRLGRYVYHTGAEEDVEVAINYFQRAIELDSSFALAQCGLGACHIQRILKGSGKPDDVGLARKAFERGLELDPAILEARVFMVFVYLIGGEKQKARKQIASLRNEAPNDASVQFVSGVLYRLSGEYNKALQSFDAALRLNPGEALVRICWGRARIFMHQGRHKEAFVELDRGAAIEPSHPLLRAFHAQALLLQGDYEAARAEIEEILINHPQMDAVRPFLAQCLSAGGEHAAALAQLTERVKMLALNDHDIPYWVATVYAMEGKDEEALKWLKTAIHLGNEDLPWFKLNPAWGALREDQRFLAILQEIEQRRPLSHGY